MADERAANPFAAGLKGRCPRCGEGPLFRGFLTLNAECDACGMDFSREDIGDGPVAFIILIVGFAVVIPALIVEVAFSWPYWLHALIWLPLAVIGCLILMRPFKAALFALQYRNKAEEARLREDEF